MAHETIRQYMAEIGSRGGNAKTQKQIAAHRAALELARRKRWPQKNVENNSELKSPSET